MITRKEIRALVNPFDINSREGRQWEYYNHVNYYTQFLLDSGIHYIVHLVKMVEHLPKISPYFNDNIPLKHWDDLGKVAQYIFNAKKFTECEHPSAVGKIIYSKADIVSFSKTLLRNHLLVNGYVEKWEIDKWFYHPYLIKTTEKEITQ